MKAERIVEQGREREAYLECLEELKERLWQEEWKDMIEVPNRAYVSRLADGRLKIIVEPCIP